MWSKNQILSDLGAGSRVLVELTGYIDWVAPFERQLGQASNSWRSRSREVCQTKYREKNLRSMRGKRASTKYYCPHFNDVLNLCFSDNEA